MDNTKQLHSFISIVVPWPLLLLKKFISTFTWNTVLSMLLKNGVKTRILPTALMLSVCNTFKKNNSNKIQETKTI